MSLTVFFRDQHRPHSFGASPGNGSVSAVLLFCIAIGLGAAFGRLWTDAKAGMGPG